METGGEPGFEGRLCSAVSRASGEEPTGSAVPFEHRLLVEVAPPWEGDVGASKNYPEGLWEALMGAWRRGSQVGMTAVLPDPEYSVGGSTRLIYLRRPDGPFAAFEKREYLLPDEHLVPAVGALFGEPEELARLEEYRCGTRSVRDIVVCTHGSHDACCGKFGYPVYETLRREHADPDGLRVWRASHLGGHRFAPTLVDYPEGRYWGRLEPGAIEGLVSRDVPASELRRFHRGWSGLESPFEQIAEGEILSREGWRWAGYLKRGRVLAADEDEHRAEVRVEYRNPDGTDSGSYTAVVEASGSVETLIDSGSEPLQEVRQYRVEYLEKTSQGGS
ncbi:sucrase ferredoxin [Rubrobacter marinus]|uniref:Sucrase ferredoxin n=1 Tax=Rubrobacter marinus TaxID=2653852 RepID=A0A6G8PZA7_9ACTN|nr:sucrase ferredoxin [Rubrobacter marinus]QIN79551.1 sucrase ferredoxin [Rubrobacter marinus]